MRKSLALLTALALLLVSAGAWGYNDGQGRQGKRQRQRGKIQVRQVPAVSNPLYSQQCGACHFAFQPALLPAASWKKIMAGLNDHFGEEPDLGPQDREAIARYLEANAADFQSNRISLRIMQTLGGATPLRVSQTPFFLCKHQDARLPPKVFERESVGSRGNCRACHPGAAQGVYDRRLVRIPH